jgi:hypothetical protein
MLVKKEKFSTLPGIKLKPSSPEPAAVLTDLSQIPYKKAFSSVLCTWYKEYM